jgi:hypothetical protein
LDNPVRTTLLVIHGLLAVALLGATTHQALAAGASDARARRGLEALHDRVDPAMYSRIIVALFIATALLGAVLYPAYRNIVRPVLELSDLRAANGAFEVKEHLSALGLLLLPAYWAAWTRTAEPRYKAIRRVLTWILTAVVWWSFVVGLVLNNIHGLFT